MCIRDRLNPESIPAPKVLVSAKWLGFGISIPSNFHCKYFGLLPCTLIPLLPTLLLTPAKVETNLAGSSNPPAYRLASSTPVSYTHLDVYKRQLLYSAGKAPEKKSEFPKL